MLWLIRESSQRTNLLTIVSLLTQLYSITWAFSFRSSDCLLLNCRLFCLTVYLFVFF